MPNIRKNRTVARNPVLLGAALRRQRRQLKLTQTQLSERAGLRQATISGLESGAAAARVDTLMLVLATLGLELVVQPRTRAEPNSVEDIF